MLRDVHTMTDEEVVEFIWRMPETCALDVIESGKPMKLQRIADLLGGMSRERVRQLAVRGRKQWEENALEISFTAYDFYVLSTGPVSESC